MFLPSRDSRTRLTRYQVKDPCVLTRYPPNTCQILALYNYMAPVDLRNQSDVDPSLASGLLRPKSPC